MNEHKVIGYEVCSEGIEGIEGKQSWANNTDAFYVFGDEKHAMKLIKTESHKEKKVFLKKIRFKTIIEMMDSGDAFTFDSIAWERISQIAMENNLDFPKKVEVDELGMVTIEAEKQDHNGNF
jgi:hypothetical protein